MSHELIIRRERQFEAGVVRCGAGEPDMRVLGPIQGWCISFPRLPLKLEQTGSAAFLADGTTALLLAPGAVLARRPLCAQGSRCHWIGLSDELLEDARSQRYPEHEDVFRRGNAVGLTKSVALTLLERRFFRCAARPDAMGADFSELAIGLLDAALAPHEPLSLARGDRVLALAARELLIAEPARVRRSGELAGRLGVSVFHLCRAFRRAIGLTIQEYSRRLRLEIALERLAEPDVDLSMLAFDLGFSSHSHFSAAFRRIFGLSPSDYRERRRRGHRRAIA